MMLYHKRFESHFGYTSLKLIVDFFSRIVPWKSDFGCKISERAYVCKCHYSIYITSN